VVQQRTPHPVLARLIGIKLKKARKKKGLTQAQVAYMLRVSPPRITHTEKGMSVPHISTLLALCDIYDIEVSDIISMKEYREIRKRGLK